MGELMTNAVEAILALHCKQPRSPGDIIGPYCAECTSPIDGGPELWPCKTVKILVGSIDPSAVRVYQTDADAFEAGDFAASVGGAWVPGSYETIEAAATAAARYAAGINDG
jgi:hypothetical protein